MTAQQLVDELRESLGNRTDLVTARYLRWLNWALLDLCGFHRKRLFAPKQFHVLEREAFFQTNVVNNNCGGSASATTFQVTGTDAVATVGYYNGCLVVLTSYSGTAPAGLLNQKRVIVSYGGAPGSHICTISEPWSVVPNTSTKYTIYRRKFSLTDDVGISADDVVYAVERIEEAASGKEVFQKDWRDLVGLNPETTGDPTQFARRGNSIIFDKKVGEAKWYHVWYYKLPTLLVSTALTLDPEVPEDWHEAIVQGAIWRGFEKLMEPLRASEARARYVDLATDKLDGFEIERVNVNRGIKVKVG